MERFINMATYRGAELKNILEKEDGSVEMTVSIKKFRLTSQLARKAKCKVKIKRRGGLPFILHKYRNRKFFVLGAFLFVAAIWYLSTFIWLVDISGARVINLADLTTFFKEQGIEAGKTKIGLNERALEKEAMRRFSDISWINVDIKGTRVKIILTETKPAVEMRNDGIPSDIIALRDGIISKIATGAGTPLFKIGDVVKKGDTIVTGKIIVGNDETGFREKWTRAESKVYAKIYYTETVDVPLAVVEKRTTGRIKKEYSLLFLDKVIDLPRAKPNFRGFEIAYDKKTLKFGDNYPLPFSVSITEYRETTDFRRVLSNEEAELIGVETAIAKIFSRIKTEAEIVENKAVFEEGDGFLRATVNLTVNERIDVEQPIIK